jgi:hypothetical protein
MITLRRAIIGALILGLWMFGSAAIDGVTEAITGQTMTALERRLPAGG